MRTVIFLLAVVIAFGFFIINIKRLISYLKIGEKENRFDKPWERLKNVLTVAIGQSKLFREPVAGLMHAFIFWGFLSLLIIVLESLIQGFYFDFSFAFLGGFYNVITFLQDIFCALVIIAVFVALYRRFVQKVKRLKSEKNHELEAALILLMILTVIISIFGQNIFNPHHSSNEYRFVSQALAGWLMLEPSSFVYEIFWWIHLLTILIFLNFLPFSKHLHILTSIPNVYFSKLSNEKGTIKPINLEDESLTHFGAIDIEHLTWKNIFDGYTCTECGRCTSACPANNTGKTLSPRKIIMDIRQRTLEKAPLILTKKESELSEKTLVHNHITDEEIWACTTCNACVTECPVMIEHL
ncbi:MAG: 4Fe-4S dicluster domain-containing protein, partial [Ignavibacteria bacterium]|nr:4Fe-4S dicluster domain-containing protein [Ignavibacteria bacterium]